MSGIDDVTTLIKGPCSTVRNVDLSYALGRVFALRLCHSGQTYRFRHCSVVAVGAFEYPEKNSRNSNKENFSLCLS